MSYSEELLLAVQRKMNRAIDGKTRNLPEWAWNIPSDKLHEIYENNSPKELRDYFLGKKLLEFEDDGEKWVIWDRNESVQVEVYKVDSEQTVMVELMMPKKMIKELSKVLENEPIELSEDELLKEVTDIEMDAFEIITERIEEEERNERRKYSKCDNKK